eukprot:scaffold17853_cov65-Cyclotella_meneghiniana.AAC.9
MVQSLPLLLSVATLLLSLELHRIDAFAPSSLNPSTRCVASTIISRHQNRDNFAILSSHHDSKSDDESPGSKSTTATRRSILQSTAISLITLSSNPQSTPASISLNPFKSSETPQSFTPSKRCTAYLIDSTIPPSLIPYRARREAAILKNLGMGKGTSKAPLLQDEINLNNFMNKAVFGVIDNTKLAVESVVGNSNKNDNSNEKAASSSFVFLGANFDGESPTAMGNVNADGELAVSLMKDICRPRERDGNTAIGLAFAPVTAQNALDAYIASSKDEAAALDNLKTALKEAGANESLIERHIPILQFAHDKHFPLLALSPDPIDLQTLQKGGLQSLDPAKRDYYVADTNGFISLTQDPKFKLYTEKSLLKDFVPSSTTLSEEQYKNEQANYFAERILVHEAGATGIARWASSRPDSLVITVASIPDVRFMGGMNGRVGRVYGKLLSEGGGNDSNVVEVDEDAVTTILLNPSAKETLSQSRFLRLEIGTAPTNWAYQTKIADYFWFSSMPKVNMLPRMMNEQ